MSGGMEDTRTLDEEWDKATVRATMSPFCMKQTIQPEPEAEEMVTNPKHYHIGELGIDAMEIIRAVLGEEGWKAYCKGNMLKYLLRKKWDEDEDVAKCGRYADMYKGKDLRGK